MGRATQGVRLINLKGNDQIAAVAKVERTEEEDVEDAVILDESGNQIINKDEEPENTETLGDEKASDEDDTTDNGKNIDNNDED